MPAAPDPLAGLRAEADPRDPRGAALLRPLKEGTAPTAGQVAIVGMPYDGGIPSRPGARFGPRALRHALAAFSSYDGARELRPITDLGDLALPTMNGARAHERVEAAARAVFATDALPVFIGGDHGLTGSVVRGLAAAQPSLRLALINIDAHLDVREYEDAAALSSGTPFRRALETEVLDGPHVAVVGLRRFANSRFYLDWARERGLHLSTVEDVQEIGAVTLMRRVLDEITTDADALYLSIDLDVADAAFAPGVSAAGIGGLSARELIALVRTAAAHPRLIGADIMELSPPYDVDQRTAKLAARLLLEITAARP